MPGCPRLGNHRSHSKDPPGGKVYRMQEARQPGVQCPWAQGHPGLCSLRALHWVRQHAPRLPHSKMTPKAVSWPKHRASGQSSQRAGLTARPPPGSQTLHEAQRQEHVTSQGTQDALRGHPPFQDHRPLRKNSEGLRSTNRKARYACLTAGKTQMRTPPEPSTGGGGENVWGGCSVGSTYTSHRSMGQRLSWDRLELSS